MIRKLAVFTLVVVSLAMRVEASQVPTEQVKDKIVKHSVEMGVDPAIALSLAKAESGFRHDSRSPHGAVGVFQLMPGTAKRLGVNPYHIDGNIRGGLMYYKMLYKMFGSNELALAAYHTGPAYVLKHKRPAPCSKNYISTIMKEYYRLKAHTDPAILRHNDWQKVIQQAKDVKMTGKDSSEEGRQVEKAKTPKEENEHSAYKNNPGKSV